MGVELSPSECRRFWDSASDYLDGHLDDDIRSRFQNHIESCSACEEFANDLRWTIGRLSGLREPSTSKEEEARVIHLYAEFFPEPDVPAEVVDWTPVKQMWSELSSLSPNERHLVIRKNCKYRDSHLCDWLVVRARRISGTHPERGLPLAESAVAIGRLRASECADLTRLVRSLEALAWCQVHLRDYSQANRTLNELRDLCSKREVDPEERLLYLAARGLFYSNTGRLQESQKCLSEAVELSRRGGQRKSLICQLVNLAGTMLTAGPVENALELFKEAEALLDPQCDPPRLQRVVYSNLVLALCEAGRTAEARRHLPRVRDLSCAVGGWYPKVYAHWLEGSLARAEGEYESAEQIFESVRQEFLRRGHLVWHVEASLDLARSRLAQGKVGGLRLLAAELLRTIEELDGDRRVWSAVVRLAEALRAHSLTEQVLSSIAIALSSAKLSHRYRD